MSPAPPSTPRVGTDSPYGLRAAESTPAHAVRALGLPCALSPSAHVRQLDAVAARFLAHLAAHTPLLPGAEQVAFVDADDSIGRTYGYHKQGAGLGYAGIEASTR